MTELLKGWPLENLEETERETFAQKYLQNPFSVRWSALAQLCQDSEPELGWEQAPDE